MYNRIIERVACVCALFTIVFCSNLFALIKFPPQKAILPNGMRVIVVEDKSLPTVAAGILFDTSVIKGKFNNAAMGRLILKMLASSELDGLSRFDYNKKVEKAGILQNFVKKMQILFNGCMGEASTANTMLEAIKDSSFNLKPSVETLLNSKKKALSDIKTEKMFPLAQDYLTGKVWKELYGTNIMGLGGTVTSDDISAINLDDVKKAMGQILVPNNSVLVIVGDVNTSEIFKQCMKIFGDLKAVKVKCSPGVCSKVNFDNVKKVSREYLKIDKVQAVVAFPAPAYSDNDMPTALLWQAVLSEINDAWLPHKFGKEFPELDDLEADYIPGKRHGLFVIKFSSSNSNVDRPISFILSSIGSLFLAPPKGRELEKLVNIEQLDYLKSREIRFKRVFMLGYSEIMGTYKISDSIIAFWKRISSADMRNCAKKIFGGSQYAVEIAYPLKFKKAEKQEVKFCELKNGMKILVKNHSGSEIIGVAVRIGLDMCQADKAQAYKGRIVSEMITQLINDNEKERIRRKLDDIGSKLTAQTINGGLYILGNTTRKNLPELIRLLGKMISEPKKSERFFKIAKKNLKKLIASRKADNWLAILSKTNSILFPGLITDLNQIDEKYIDSLQKKDADKFFKNFVSPSNMQVVVVGNINTGKVAKLMGKEFSLIKPQKQTPLASCPAWLDTPLEKNIEKTIILPSESQFAIIGVAFRMKKIIGMTDKNALREHFGANSVISNLLFAGKNSILKTELENAGIQIGNINGSYSSTKNDSLFYFYVEVPVGKLDVAIKIVKEIISKIPSMKVSDEDIKTAGKWLASVFNVGLERSDVQAMVMSSFIGDGLKYNYLPELMSIYNTVTIKDVTKACKSNFNHYLLMIGKPK